MVRMRVLERAGGQWILRGGHSFPLPRRNPRSGRWREGREEGVRVPGALVRLGSLPHQNSPEPHLALDLGGHLAVLHVLDHPAHPLLETIVRALHLRGCSDSDGASVWGLRLEGMERGLPLSLSLS